MQLTQSGRGRRRSHAPRLVTGRRQNPVYQKRSALGDIREWIEPSSVLAGWRGSAPQCCGRWTPDGKFFIFQSQSRGLFLGGAELRALDERHGHFRRPPSEPYPLAAGPVRWSWPIPSLDGKAIFARGIIFRGELSRVDVRTHRFEPFLSRNFRTGPLVLQRRPVRGACFLPRGHPLESQPGWKQPRATE